MINKASLGPNSFEPHLSIFNCLFYLLEDYFMNFSIISDIVSYLAQFLALLVIVSVMKVHISYCIDIMPG